MKTLYTNTKTPHPKVNATPENAATVREVLRRAGHSLEEILATVSMIQLSETQLVITWDIPEELQKDPHQHRGSMATWKD